jgi:hypothetical protein
MLIQVHTDKNIEGTEAFAAHVKGVVERYPLRLPHMEQRRAA